MYYRVKLGLEGYTSVKAVDFDQLTTSDPHFFPSPMNGMATVVLNARNGAAVDLFIHDASGREVLARSGLPGPIIALELPSVTSGTYSYRALSEGQVFEGRFVRE